MTIAVEKLAALTAAPDSLAFWGNDAPKCPHCGHSCGIGKYDLNRLYEEGTHEVDCPACDLPFSVVTRVSFTFSTDDQS